MNLTRSAILAVLLLTLFGCVGGNSTRALQTQSAFVPTKVSSQPQAHKADMGPPELQAAVMSHADTMLSRIAEVATIIEKIGTPQARLTAARMMVFDVSSYVEIAAGPYPGIALLDLMVLTSLKRMIWEEFWVPKFGKQAEPALKFIRENEREMWELAANILNQEQLDEIANVVIRWRKRNPDMVGINYVRFSDFGELGLKPSMQRLTVPGGLFASVKEAALVAQDMKVAIDRAFYLMSRMQLVISFQIKLAYLEIMFQPETNGIINQAEQMAGVTNRYAEIAERLPEQLGNETSKLVNQVFANLAINRDETITSVLTGMEQWQDHAIKGVMTEISQERKDTIDHVLEGLAIQQKEMRILVENMVDRSGSEVEETLNHAFLLGTLLIIIFFMMLSLYKLLIGRAIKKS